MLVAVSQVDGMALEEERMVMQSLYEADGNDYGHSCNRSQENRHSHIPRQINDCLPQSSMCRDGRVAANLRRR